MKKSRFSRKVHCKNGFTAMSLDEIDGVHLPPGGNAGGRVWKPKRVESNGLVEKTSPGNDEINRGEPA